MTSPQAAAGTAVVTTAVVDYVAQAQALQSILADLGTVTVQQVVGLFRQYSDAADFPSLLKQALPEIVRPHADAAAHITAQWYDEINPASAFEATPVVDLAPERIDKTIDWALHAPTTPASAAHTHESPVDLQSAPDLAPFHEKLDDPTQPDPDVVLSRLSGSVKRMVADASRDTVLSSSLEEGVRWARYASANACAFCRLLATRQAVYRSEADALTVSGASVGLTMSDRRQRAGGLATTDELLARRMGQKTYVAGKNKGQEKSRQLRGTREKGDRYHDHCRCIAVPVRDGVYTPPDYMKQWEQDYIAARRDVGKQRKPMSAKNILASMRANTDAS